MHLLRERGLIGSTGTGTRAPP